MIESRRTLRSGLILVALLALALMCVLHVLACIEKPCSRRCALAVNILRWGGQDD